MGKNFLYLCYIIYMLFAVLQIIICMYLYSDLEKVFDRIKSNRGDVPTIFK